MIRSFLRAASLASVLVSVYACTSDDETTPPPSGLDASFDAPTTDATKNDAGAADVSVADAIAPDTSAPDVADPDTGIDAGTDAATDAAADVVIVGCIPQEISTRYDATWHFGTRCVAAWDTNNQLSFSDAGIAFAGFEGTISAANPFTGVLFAASDGIDIYGSDGGKTNDAALGGNPSAAQPVAFMGKPGSANDFYVVTNSANANPGTGLHYSTLECGNATPIAPPTSIANTTNYTEALVVLRHANNVDRWMMSLAPTGIVVVPVTSAGFGTPVITDISASLPGVQNGQRAFIAFARDRHTFAITAEYVGAVVGQFDNATGTISAVKAVPVPSTTYLYSAAFSPDATKLYVSQYSGAFHQIDLAAALADGGLDASTSPSLGTAAGALRLAIDDKIYLAMYGQTTLKVINNPNAAAGALDIQTVTLPTGCTSSYGLPGVGDL